MCNLLDAPNHSVLAKRSQHTSPSTPLPPPPPFSSPPCLTSYFPSSPFLLHLFLFRLLLHNLYLLYYLLLHLLLLIFNSDIPCFHRPPPLLWPFVLRHPKQHFCFQMCSTKTILESLICAPFRNVNVICELTNSRKRQTFVMRWISSVLMKILFLKKDPFSM